MQIWNFLYLLQKICITNVIIHCFEGRHVNEGRKLAEHAVWLANNHAHFLLALHIYFVKALTHGAIFLATCNAILLLEDVKLANTSFHHRLLTIFWTHQTFLTNLRLLRVELRCKLQQKLHRACDRALTRSTSRNVMDMKET